MKRLWLVTVQFEGLVWASSQADAEDLADEVVEEWNDADITSRRVSRKDVPKEMLDDTWPTHKKECPGTLRRCLEIMEAQEEEEKRLARERAEWEAHPKLEFA